MSTMYPAHSPAHTPRDGRPGVLRDVKGTNYNERNQRDPCDAKSETGSDGIERERTEKEKQRGRNGE